MISSTIPSAKYSCSGSPLMFWNGSTAMDGGPRHRISKHNTFPDLPDGQISDGLCFCLVQP
jgi:hypothetical protein